jgi:ribosomal protein S19
MRPSEKEKLIKKNMEALDISYEEAKELVEDDERVDRGESLPWDLTPEQMKVSKKARQADHAKPKEKVKKEKKENVIKKEIIENIFNLINENYENATVENDERMIAFSVGDENFEITLVQKRKKKS